MPAQQPTLDGTCSTQDCDRGTEKRGMCGLHYQRWAKAFRKAGLPLPPAPPRPAPPPVALTGSTIRDEEYRKKTRQRMRANSTPDPITGCWIWQKALDRDGYGVAQAGRRDSAHRVAYLTFVGPIPDGLVLDHRCHTEDTTCAGGISCLHRRCVNPAHLEPVTSGQNALRGRSPWAKNARKTHCKHGHEFTPENTIQIPNGRACRTCVRATNAASMRKKNKEKAMARNLQLAEQLAAARRDKTLAEIVQQSAWDRYVVMQVVLLHGATRDSWSANDIRHLLPEQGRGFLGAAINGLRVAGYITQLPTPGVPSTLPKTKGHRLAVWTLTAKGHREGARGTRAAQAGRAA